jgi:hypothetical protein
VWPCAITALVGCLSTGQAAAGVPREHTIVVESRFTHLSPGDLTIEQGERVVIKRPGAPTDVAFRIRLSPLKGVSGLSGQLDVQHVLAFEEPGTFVFEVSSFEMGIPGELRGKIVVRAAPGTPAIATAPAPAPARPPASPPPALAPLPPAAPGLLSDPDPPRIAIAYPKDEQRVPEPTVAITGVIQDNVGLAAVELTVNRQRVDLPGAPRPGQAVKSYAIDVDVPLAPGRKLIVVTARDQAGHVQREARTVSHQPTTAAPAPGLTGDRWAVVSGIGRYEHPAVRRLRYTVADAEAIYETLITRAGFKKERVLLLTDKTERFPTLRNIRSALGTFLARSAKRDDTVVVFFAGHGAPEPDPRGLERDGLAKYLVPSDADPDDLFATALPMDEIQTIFGRIEAERVVMFLDTCYSGAAGGRTFAARRTRATNVDDLFLERLTRAKGRAILTASRPAEVSIELPELGHGLFTYYLVRGLQGGADLNRDGIVTLQELYEYVESTVSQKARAAGGNQHPVMKGELEGSLPLVTVRGR